MVNKRMVMIPGPTPVVKSIQDQMGREVQALGDPRLFRITRMSSGISGNW